MLFSSWNIYNTEWSCIICIYVSMFLHTYTYVPDIHPSIYTCMHTYIHTYIHTYSYPSFLSPFALLTSLHSSLWIQSHGTPCTGATLCPHSIPCTKGVICPTQKQVFPLLNCPSWFMYPESIPFFFQLVPSLTLQQSSDSYLYHRAQIVTVQMPQLTSPWCVLILCSQIEIMWSLACLRRGH